MRMRRRLAGIAAALLTLIFPLNAVSAEASPQATGSPEQAVKAIVLGGVSQMMDGNLAAAIRAFQQAQTRDPSSPVGYLLEADATWWRIYYSSANLIDPDVFDVVYADHTPYDERFESLIKTCIDKAKARIHNHDDLAQSYLYEGMAYALRGRLDGLRAKDLATARDGKKMRSLLLTALQLDPNLADAYTGIGLYNYFVATLPTIVKMLRFLIGLPGGSREEGIEQLYKAAAHGEYTRAEAKFYLAKDFTRSNELQFHKSLELFEQLEQEFPENLFWKLMVASIHMRLGEKKEGDPMYRQVLAATANSHRLVDTTVHRQVLQALERLHPGEKFE